MNMRNFFLAGAAFSAVGSAFAAPIVVTSPNFAGNGAARTAWLAASGIAAPGTTADFEPPLATGNIHGIVNIYPGLTITSTNSVANVTNSSSALGSSNPVGLQALAALESQVYTIDFMSSVDYFSLLHMDLTTLSVTVHYTDSTTSVHSHSGSGSSGNTAVFFGLYRNDKPGIDKIVLDGNGGDGEWGIDNVEYGVVPEPATMAVLGVGALGIIRKRRSR